MAKIHLTEPNTRSFVICYYKLLLEQQTTLEAVEVMSNTTGYTDMVLGLYWLLGYQFSPRIINIGKTRLWLDG